MYYDCNKTLSRHRLFNFVLGARGTGKTFSAKERAIKNFLRKGEQFIYLRRYETELVESLMKNFFTDVGQKKFPDTDFGAHNSTFKINGKVAGWYLPLSKGQILKSIPFDKVSLIIFDEFIINQGLVRYLPQEVTTFLETYSTISRDRDVPVLFLANSLTIANPYFLYFNISFEPEQKVKLTKNISVEYYESDEFIYHMNNTRFGELVSDTPYGQYAIENKFLLDTETFLEKLTAGCDCICTLKFGETILGAYNSPSGKVYLSEDIDPTIMMHLVVQEKDHDESTILAPRNNVIMKILAEKFAEGNLRFTSQTAKATAYNILKGWI